MSYDPSKPVELYLLKASNFSEESAPNQKKYYLEAARWLQENNFSSPEEATEAMRHTEYYEGAGIAKIADDIELRIKAMEKAGYEDVAEIHRERLRKFRQSGNSYAFSQEWIDDFNKAAEKEHIYAERKAVFGRIFSGYFQIAGNPQKEHRQKAAKGISDALKELDRLGATFDELAADKVYRNLTMTTEKGMNNFIDFIHAFMKSGGIYEDDISDIADEQQRLAKWAAANRAALIEAGRSETWRSANCVAVPSEDPGGYDFIAMKEVEY